MGPPLRKGMPGGARRRASLELVELRVGSVIMMCARCVRVWVWRVQGHNVQRQSLR